MFAPGVPGTAYALHARNLTTGRIEVIVTVDGRHILKDEPGDPYACHGMVLQAYGSYDFRGWRISDSWSREFLFGEPGASVAAQSTGSLANTGVIGFAVWREQPALAADYGGFLRGGAPVAVAAASSSSIPGGSLGTGIGASQDDRVGRTEFARVTGEPDILIIGYDTESELIRRGITCPAEPDPFPGARTGYEKYTAS
jgi:hypothetical protein